MSSNVLCECSNLTCFKKVAIYISQQLSEQLIDSILALPKLIGDVQASMEKLKNDPSGMTDPWESLYRVVYQLTIRIVGCDDIASDPELLEKTLQLYETIEASSTPIAVIFPKFPSLGIIKRTIAGGRLYMILKKIVDHRKATGTRGDDPLQFLIDEGDDVPRIIEVCHLRSQDCRSADS